MDESIVRVLADEIDIKNSTFSSVGDYDEQDTGIDFFVFILLWFLLFLIFFVD